MVPTRTLNDRIFPHVRNAVLALGALLGLVVLVRFIFIRTWNYDELSHAHMAWLVSVGEIPYRDFAINHFPFFWAPVSVLMRILPQNSGGLMMLRGGALLLNCVFIGALGTLITAELPARQRIWSAACFALVVFSPLSLHFLMEFRPDALANALLFPALLWLVMDGTKRAWVALVCGFCIGAAILINTKYIFFPFILAAAALALNIPRVLRAWPFILSLCTGFAAALLCGFCLLNHMQIEFGEAWRMVISYNSAAEKAHTFGYGLAWAVAQRPVLLAYCVAGLIGCGVLFFRRREFPGFFAIAIFLFLTINLATSTRPWKQYAVSWFLLAAWFPARSLPSLLARLNTQAQIVAALCIVGAMVAGLAGMPLKDPSGAGDIVRASQDRLIDVTPQLVAPDGFVAAGFPMHPVFRRDSFFKVVIDMTTGDADGLERFMPELDPGPYSEHFTQRGYEKELALRPPSMIVVRSLFTEAQTRALNVFLKSNVDSYEYRDIPDSNVTVLVRTNAGQPGTN